VDHFEVFGLPRRLSIDTGALQQRFYELSRRYHPDFHQGSPAEEQQHALEASARVNAAYRALRDPLARIEYLVRLEEGRDTAESATVKPTAPPELLAEMFEIQEALEEAKSGGLDVQGRTGLVQEHARLLVRLREEEERLCGPLSRAWDDATDAAGRTAALARFNESLATRAYLRTVVDDLGEAVGESRQDLGQGQAHAAHHRD